MRSSLTWSLFLFILVSACKSKEEKKEEPLFPVIPFLHSQVANVDTSLFAIKKYVMVDSTRTDTIHLNRSQFKSEAVDFLSLPDLSDPKISSRFRETSQYDETLEKVIITQLPVDAAKELVQRQELTISPNPAGDKIHSIYISTNINNRDSSVQKKMLWQVDKSFQVTTIKQYPGQPETIQTFRVVWNEDE